MNHIGMILPLVAVAALLLSLCINGRVIFLRPAGATHMRTVESTTHLHGPERKAASQAVGWAVCPGRCQHAVALGPPFLLLTARRKRP